MLVAEHLMKIRFGLYEILQRLDQGNENLERLVAIVDYMCLDLMARQNVLSLCLHVNNDTQKIRDILSTRINSFSLQRITRKCALDLWIHVNQEKNVVHIVTDTATKFCRILMNNQHILERDFQREKTNN